MPELPDVERFRRVFEAHATGQSVNSVTIRDSGVIRGLTGAEFAKRLKGRIFGNPLRRGKWLIVPAEGNSLLLHFGMTGSLVWDEAGDEFERFDRVAFDFEYGRLIFRDQRKLGALWFTKGERGVREITGDQGPDALGLTGRDLEARLEAKSGALKSALMDQSALAGIGNMLSDEVLWRAKIHPARRYASLNAKERRDLDRSLQAVLKTSVNAGKIPRTASWLSSQRSRPIPLCPRCHEDLEASSIGGRTSYWCPICQRRPDCSIQDH